jgi:hypothetical protein
VPTFLPIIKGDSSPINGFKLGGITQLSKLWGSTAVDPTKRTVYPEKVVLFVIL